MLKLLKIKALTPYEFIVRKIKGKEFYYIIKVKGKSHTKKFDSIIKENTKVIEIRDGKDVFTYDRRISMYEGKVNIDNKKRTD